MFQFLGELSMIKKIFEFNFKQTSITSIQEYWSKRDFNVTTEPKGEIRKKSENKKMDSYVIQKHHATRLHFDLRLERGGVLKSWALPKGIPEKSGIRRLSIQTEDHPLEYAKFEGTIPKGQYGAGEVIIWDKGQFKTKIWQENKIEIFLQGTKLNGRYVLIKLKNEKKKNWLILKAKE
jgi:bifunctional non-homologous end joining protein LigD